MQLDRIRKYYYLKFVRLKGDPKSLAWGTAIGVFIGLTPTIPLHTGIILFLALVTRTSVIAAMLSSWIVCNPLTYIPIYFFSTMIGNALTPYELNWNTIKTVVNALSSSQSFMQAIQLIAGVGVEALIVLLVGGTVFALPFAVISYYLAFYTFVKIRMKRRAKHVLN